jgi:hypothetical protein
MKITLKKLAHNARLSHETACYSADVYIDGKKAGTAENSGTGGADLIQPHSLQKLLEDYAATLPPITLDGHTIPESAETVLGKALDAALAERRLGRLLKKHVVFVRDQKVYTVKGVFLPKPGDVVLNHLPMEQAVERFLGCA